MTSAFDSYRPPERRRRRRSGGGKRRRRGNFRGADGSREMPMVDDVEFQSYYGRPIVKSPPWGAEISVYLFLGGLAGGSSILAAGARRADAPALRRNCRLVSLGAVGAGALALIADLGRPERFLNMMRTVKVTSPMSLGSWILAAFSTSAGTVAVIEVDALLPVLRGPLKHIRSLEAPASAAAAVLGSLLSTYTGVLLGGTSVPTWNAAGRAGLPLLFAASASMASGGAAMALTPVSQAGPARLFALAGSTAEAVIMRRMTKNMHPAEVEPMETGSAGRKLRTAEVLGLAGAAATAALDIGARIARRKNSHALAGLLQAGSAVAGAALAASSALTRFGMMEAGHSSAADPKHVVEPQRARLEERRSRGIYDDSITTGPRPS